MHADQIFEDRRSQKRFAAEIALPPRGASIRHPEVCGSCLILEDKFVPFSDTQYRYGAPLPRPRSGKVEVLTLRCSVKIRQVSFELESMLLPF